MYSLERRHKRYLVLYVWKVVNGLVPNMSGPNKLTTYRHIRRGLLCNVAPVNNRCLCSIRTLKDGSFIIRGPKLFNELPINLREYNGSIDGFKHRLDIWLSTIKDQPSLPNYYQPAAGNSILDQLAQLRAERM